MHHARSRAFVALSLLLCLLAVPLVTHATSVLLQWDTYVQGTDPAVGFTLYHQAACTGTYGKVGTGSIPVTATSISDTTVLVGQTYCWTLKAVDAAGTESDPSNVVTLTVPQPAAPSALSGTYSNGGVNLAWSYTQGADPAVNFVVEKQVGCAGTWTQLATTVVTQTTYRDTAILTTVSYCYRVSAIDQTGGESTLSNVLTFSVPKPAQPKNLRGTLSQ